MTTDDSVYIHQPPPVEKLEETRASDLWRLERRCRVEIDELRAQRDSEGLEGHRPVIEASLAGYTRVLGVIDKERARRRQLPSGFFGAVKEISHAGPQANPDPRRKTG